MPRLSLQCSNCLRLHHQAQRGRPMLVLLVLVSCCLWFSCNAYPELYVEGYANSCTAHPTEGLGAHGSPVPDKTTTFSLSPQGSSSPESALCPGVPYKLVVNYGSFRRRTLLTSSVGVLGSSGGLPADKACPNRASSQGSGTDKYSNTLTIPCGGAASSVLLQVTSAGGSTDKFHTAATTLTLKPAAQCPGSTCPGAPAAAAAAAAAAPKNNDAAAPAAPQQDGTAAAAAAAALTARGSSGNGGGGCSRSAYNYACSVKGGDGATLHYTLSSSAQPPENTCTAAAAAAAAGSSDGQQYLHMLLETSQPGYSGVAFANKLGDMYPADAVIGYVDPATAKPVVSAYHLTDYSPNPSATNNNGLGWATHMAAAQPPAATTGSSGSSRLLCFSRAVDAPAAAVVKNLDPKAVKVNWVSDSSIDLTKRHSQSGGLLLNAAGGSSSAVSSSSSRAEEKLQKQLAHGALMLLAFVAFLPLGSLLARHKWMFGDKEKGSIRAGWFHLHRSLQLLAVLLAVAGFVVALVCFKLPWVLSAATPSALYNPHRIMGVVLMGLLVLQVVLGVVRPGMSHGHRSVWRAAHLSLGWITMALGVVVVLLGVVLMQELTGAPYINWLLPVLLLLGLMAAAALVGEVMKIKLQRSGAYDHSNHSFSSQSVRGGSAADKLTSTNRAVVRMAARSSDASNGAAAAAAVDGADVDVAGGSPARGNTHSHLV